MTKQFYETPTTKTLVVRFQGVLCGSPIGGIQNISGENVNDDSDGWGN